MPVISLSLILYTYTSPNTLKIELFDIIVLIYSNRFTN